MSILYCPLLTTLPQSAIDLPCEGGSAARYVPVNGWNPMPEHYSHSSFANMSELTVLDPRYGYFVNVFRDAVLEFTGQPAPVVPFQLRYGTQLLGFQSQVAWPLDQVPLGEVAKDCPNVYKWDDDTTLQATYSNGAWISTTQPWTLA